MDSIESKKYNSKYPPSVHDWKRHLTTAVFAPILCILAISFILIVWHKSHLGFSGLLGSHPIWWAVGGWALSCLIGLVVGLYCRNRFFSKFSRYILEAENSKIVLERLKTITDVAPVALVYIDREERFVYANKNYIENFDRPNPIGKHLISVIGENAYKNVESYIKQALAGETVRFDLEILRNSQAPLQARVIYAPHYNAMGEVEGLVSISEDITGLKQSEKLLQDNEERFQFALQSANLGTWEVDLATQQMSVSDEMFKIWEIDPHEFTGERSLFQAKVHPLDRQTMLQAIEKSVQNNEVYEMDYRIYPRKGIERWVLSRGRCYYEPGSDKPAKFTGVVADITSRRLHEEYDRVLFELSGSGAWEIDPQTNRFVRVNSRFVELIGYSEVELKQLKYGDLAPPEERSAQNEMFEKLKTGTETGWRVERRYIRKDGTDLWVYCSGYIQRNSAGMAITILNTFYDISSIKATQLALENAVQARDNFLSIASHELKTPLTSLQLQIQLRQRDLKRTESDSAIIEKMRTSLDTQYQYVQRISSLIDDILDVSRIVEGKLSYHFDHFDLCELVTNVIARFQVNAEARKITIHFESCKPVYGKYDQFRIEQVVLNLLTNSFRYGKGLPIHVRVWSEGINGFISIKDQGMGIKPEDQKRIFERFERAISENEVSGLGLGLFVSSEISKAHGGDISVISQEGHGAEFIVKLPILEEAP